MTADEYVPDEEQVRAWCREGTGDYPDMMDEWITRFLTRVRRDAAREALAVLADMYPYGADEYVLTAHRDHYYPEESP